jgi:polyisoprenoid-binding protein YceI
MTRILAALASTLIAGAALAAAAAPSYTQAPAGNSLQFTFTQLDATSTGRFARFATTLVYDEKNLAASSLNVKVEVASLDTQDGERDDALKGADLFDVPKFPTATFSAPTLARNAAGGLTAPGKLTLRGVTKDLTLPLTLKPTTTGFELSGEVSIKRLEFGVGQGEWKSTESVGDLVKIQYKVNLVKAK